MSATAWRWIQLSSTLIWIGLIWPSVTVWRESVAWIVFMSVFANVAASAAGWMAARSEQNTVDKTDLDPIRDALRTLLAEQAVLLDRVAPVEVDQPDI